MTALGIVRFVVVLTSLLVAVLMAIVISRLGSIIVFTSMVTPAKPNIIFILVDDWGYADVSFRNPAIYTPNFNKLKDNGLLLNRHYVFKYCSPSRASFLTGRWPHHVHQFNIHPGSPLGTNINMTMLPAKLKTAGYKTHLVGKWHQGFYDSRYLPVHRGFDTSSGFLNGASSHMDQKRMCATDFWKNTDVDPRNGSYDSYLYKSDLTEIFRNHNSQDPLFIYLALHNVHDPIEAPTEWLDLYSINSVCSKRRTYQAMVSVADNITGHVVQLLDTTGLWNNTIIVVSADNGGAACMGSNYPLKGCKGTFFEGGVRSLAFTSGGLIPENMRGKSTDGFIHIADWYATFCKLAGIDLYDSGPGKFPVDGMDVWPIISGINSITPHSEIVLGYNFTNKGSIISKGYKLIVGSQGKGCNRFMWSPLDYPCSDGPSGEDCDPYCLYNIISDPSEKNNLVNTKPNLLQEMLSKYHAYSKEPRDMQDQGYHTREELPFLNSVCEYMTKYGGYWRPWKYLNKI